MKGLRDKVIGMFLGVAIGDALGMPVETMTFDQIRSQHGRINDYLKPSSSHKWYGGKLDAGMWTDDTQLTLAIAKSLIEKGDIDLDDIARKHVEAMHESSLGWGRSTINAIKKIEDGFHWKDSGSSGGAGNGIVMKISPIAAFAFQKIGIAVRIELVTGRRMDVSEKIAGDIMDKVSLLSFMTHKSGMAVVSAHIHVMLIGSCFFPKAKGSEEIFRLVFLSEIYGDCLKLEKQYAGDKEDRLSERFCNFESEVVAKKRSDKWIIDKFGQGTCYVYNSLPFSYAFFLRNPNSIETLYDVVSAGGDADTNGSIVGALLGARNGIEIFPQHLIDGLWRKDEVLKIANDFCDKFGIIE